MRGPCSFRLSDIQRAIRAAEKAGKTVAGYKVEPDGSITIMLGKPEEPELAKPEEEIKL